MVQPRHSDLSVNDLAPGERAVARSVLYRFLAYAYRYPEPAPETETASFRPGCEQALSAMGVLEDSSLRQRFRLLMERGTLTPFEDLGSAYGSLFGHCVRGSCPPYETEYGENTEPLRQPHELGDIAAFYRAFGLEIAERADERVDHISVECEYMHFLTHKQAYAEERGDEGLAKACLDGQRKFLQDHLGRWSPSFLRRLLAEADDGFYGVLARFTLEFISEECAGLGVQPDSEELRVRVPTLSMDECISCSFNQTHPDSGPGQSIDGSSQDEVGV